MTTDLAQRRNTASEIQRRRAHGRAERRRPDVGTNDAPHDHIERTAEVLRNNLDDLSPQAARFLARRIDHAGLLTTPERDAEVAARAWDEGHTAGVRNASAEFDGPVQDNPYKREGGAS